ncbi:MAG: RNA polymerase sigma factor [Asticcacaulis sp.]|uniref:RNA polymerase sigma factor n=1 Tax=Asticcacaulis sp. TaxID=1872648 RepID=UPI003F7BF2DC
MSWVREVDIWFCDEVMPHQAVFIAQAYRVTGRREVARDLVQDVYTEIMQGDKWRSVANARAFVRRAVHNAAVNWVRRQRVVLMQPLSGSEELDFVDAGPDAFETVSGREELASVIAALEHLPTRCREVVTLRRIEDLTPREIANRLGISLVTVERHLARGLTLLCDQLSESAPRRNRGRGWRTGQASGTE